MALRLTFELTLKSDYHIGAGYGLGVIDSALHRDPDGVPVVRGTTMNGLLREALRELLQLTPLHHAQRCQASGKTDTNAEYCGQWSTTIGETCPLCAIFGSPGQPKRWRISSARPTGFSSPEDKPWQPGIDGAHTAPHVRVNPRTRRAESGKLFFREEGNSELVFRFTATCDAQDAETLAEAAWLLAAARAVRQLGASRRRGRGQCEIHLISVENGTLWGQSEKPAPGWETWLLEQFETLHLQQGAVELKLPDIVFTPSVAQSDAPIRVLLIARLDEPVILSQKAEAGNEFETIDYIPGAALRGAFAALVAARHDLADTAGQSYAAFVELFTRERVRFSMLYPARFPDVKKPTAIFPTIPAPGGLLSCEIHPGFPASSAALAHGVADYTHRTALADYEPECPECHNALKPLEGFYSLQSNPQKMKKVRHIQEMHVQLAPETHRAAKGKLYSFDALRPGQFFVGELWCANSAAWEDLQTLANLPQDGPLVLRLGKANRRGYGKVTLWLQPYTGTSPWYGLPFEERVAADMELTLTLLTDAIATDTWGRFRSGFDADWLKELLGVKVELQRSFCSTRPVDAFNNHLGLPRWRDVALCAGSAVGFRIAEPLSMEQQDAVMAKMKGLENDGLGLRRNEGFGRVIFNHPLYHLWQNLKDKNMAIPLPETPTSTVTHDGNHAMLTEAAFREQWDAHLLQNNSFDALSTTEFAAVARLLQSDPPVSQKALEHLLAQLGHYETLIPDAQHLELRVRDAGRANNEFFRGGKADAGLNLVRNLGNELQEQVANLPTATQQRCWRIGMQTLAEHMIAAQKARERKRTGKAQEKEAL